MEIQFLNPKKVNRVVNTQNSVIRYYGKLAHITTEDDLEEIFLEIKDNHQVYKDRLASQLFPNQNTYKFSLKKGKSFLGKIWQEIMVAVLVNNRSKLIEYSRQNEVKLLQTIQAIISENKVDAAVKEILFSYEASIRTYVKKLEALPIVKLYKSKRA